MVVETNFSWFKMIRELSRAGVNISLNHQICHWGKVHSFWSIREEFSRLCGGLPRQFGIGSPDYVVVETNFSVKLYLKLTLFFINTIKLQVIQLPIKTIRVINTVIISRFL